MDIPGKRRKGRPNLGWIDECIRDIMYVRGGATKGQRNKQAVMAEEDQQLYRCHGQE